MKLIVLLHQDYGEQYLAQIIRFYKENPLQLLCKIFVSLFQFHDTVEKWDEPQQQIEMSIYEGRIFEKSV